MLTTMARHVNLIRVLYGSQELVAPPRLPSTSQLPGRVGRGPSRRACLSRHFPDDLARLRRRAVLSYCTAPLRCAYHLLLEHGCTQMALPRPAQHKCCFLFFWQVLLGSDDPPRRLVVALGCAVIPVTVLSACIRAPSVAFPGGPGYDDAPRPYRGGRALRSSREGGCYADPHRMP